MLLRYALCPLNIIFEQLQAQHVPAIGLNFRADIDPVMAAKAISCDLLFTYVPYKVLKFTC